MTATTSSNIFTCVPSQKVSPGSNRFHFMDALRGFALLLGVVFHAAESFCPERYSWAVVDVNAHWFFDWFQHFCHTFRMELFFLIAGFFAHLLYHKKGAITFIRNRLARIVLPFLVGWFLLYPAFIFIWMWGASVGGRLDAMGVPEAYQTLPVWKITLGSITRLSFLKVHFNLLHLWFLHHLILLYTVTLASRCLFRVILCQHHYDALTAIIDSCYRKCIQSNWLGWLVPIATVPMLLLMKGWGVDTANEQLFYLPTLLLYGFCFLLGWLLHRQPELVTFLAGKKRWWIALIAGFLLCILSYNFGRIYRWVVPDAMPNLYNRGAYLLIYASVMWCMIVGLIGAFQTWANKKSAFWRYIADSSYFIYLVHHLVVVSTQIVVSQWAAPAGYKFLIINLVSFPLLYLIYHFLVRNTWIGAWLNGRKYPPQTAVESMACLKNA